MVIFLCTYTHCTLSFPVQLLVTDFHNASAFRSLLATLDAQFRELKCHEEIEDHHIVGQLLSRLPSNTKTTLENDLHSDSRYT